MKRVRKIELLAPAKDLETGIAAIDHGADAVYIGANAFSARRSAGNSPADIGALAEYAHLYGARVYVALNTIVKEEELGEVEELIWGVYRVGADAVIIQDTGILEMRLPPIALHASTQMDNRSVDKVRFLEECGMEQVVLARELSLEQIEEIAKHTSVSLEVFVHGALCTSFSGQCYISEALSGRSANRGECAQYCRLPYTLEDGKGRTLASKRHLLSLKDLNLSGHLEELLDAGVSSLKIEGRLKDIGYVKNVTAYYRERLDEILKRRPEYGRSSSGRTSTLFHPNPEKSFNRGFTTYFLKGRQKDIASPETPKSMGEPVGNVRDLGDRYFNLMGRKQISNGDGLCFINERKELQGFRVNRVENNQIYPAEMPRLEKGMALYRNYDHEFEKALLRKTAERKVSIDLILSENPFGFTLEAVDEDGMYALISHESAREEARTPQGQNIQNQLSKLGNTIFSLHIFRNELTENWFIPSSVLNEMRRKAVESLLRARKIGLKLHSKRPYPGYSEQSVPRSLSYLANVSNSKAAGFYKRYGAREIEPAFELERQRNVPLMFTKLCLRYQLGMCTKGSDDSPFVLTTGQHRLRVEFDCRNCEMQIRD